MDRPPDDWIVEGYPPYETIFLYLIGWVLIVLASLAGIAFAIYKIAGG